MNDAPRKKTPEELKNEAIAQLEHRGYDVRGKTPAQITNLGTTKAASQEAGFNKRYGAYRRGCDALRRASLICSNCAI